MTLTTYINCAICNAPLGKLEHGDKVRIIAAVLKCDKCEQGCGGYAPEKFLNPKVFKGKTVESIHERGEKKKK